MKYEDLNKDEQEEVKKKAEEVLSQMESEGLVEIDRDKNGEPTTFRKLSNKQNISHEMIDDRLQAKLDEIITKISGDNFKEKVENEIEILRKQGEIKYDSRGNMTMSERAKARIDSVKASAASNLDTDKLNEELEKSLSKEDHEKLKEAITNVGIRNMVYNMKDDKEKMFRESLALGEKWRKDADKPFGRKITMVDKQNNTTKVMTDDEVFGDMNIVGYTDESSVFNSFNIPDTDRLRYYQILKKYLEERMDHLDAEDFVEESRMTYLKAMWKTSYGAALNVAEVFDLDDDLVPLLLNNKVAEGKMPFPNIFLNTRIQIKNRTYYGLFIGSFYTETTHYRGVFSCYSRIEMRKDKPVRTLSLEFFSLDPVDAITKKDYYTEKLKNYIFSFCRFINEPDVYTVSYPANPKNNMRRASRGALPLPQFKTVTIRGKLREYVDKVKNANASGAHRPFRYRFKVRGFYRHYRNFKRYAKLYATDSDILKQKGFEMENGILKRWVKDSERGNGPLIKQQWEVKE